MLYLKSLSNMSKGEYTKTKNVNDVFHIVFFKILSNV